MAEAAKCWCSAGGSLPKSIVEVVGNDQLIAAHFEYPTEVWGRGTSMTDVMAFIPNGVIGVEAKVDEPFGAIVSPWIFEDEKNNPDSPPHRTAVIQQYARALNVSSIKLLDIRYQLLHRTLAAAITAKKHSASNAWMIVQSFSAASNLTQSANRSDFDRFFELLGPAPTFNSIQVRLAWVSDKLS